MLCYVKVDFLKYTTHRKADSPLVYTENSLRFYVYFLNTYLKPIRLQIPGFTATNDGNIIEGDNLLLTCDVRGKPPPQIVWSRSGENGVSIEFSS